MKKCFVILLSLIALLTFSLNAIADEPKGAELEIKLFANVDGKYYFADTPDNTSDDIKLGETLNIAFSDFSEFKSVDFTGGDIKIGIMLVDDNNGEGFVSYHISDIITKSSSGNTYTIPAEGTFSGNLQKGIYEDDTALVHAFDMTDKADILANFADVSHISLSVNYISYDEQGPVPAESSPEEEEIPEVSVPNTGIEMMLLAPAIAILSMILTDNRR